MHLFCKWQVHRECKMQFLSPVTSGDSARRVESCTLAAISTLVSSSGCSEHRCRQSCLWYLGNEFWTQRRRTRLWVQGVLCSQERPHTWLRPVRIPRICVEGMQQKASVRCFCDMIRALSKVFSKIMLAPLGGHGNNTGIAPVCFITSRPQAWALRTSTRPPRPRDFDSTPWHEIHPSLPTQ